MAQHSAPHTLTAGTILVARSMGEQTDVSFYQVLKATPRTVTVRPVAAAKDHDHQAMTYRARPVPEAFTSGPFRRTVVNFEGTERIAVGYRLNARRWDEQPERGSTYA